MKFSICLLATVLTATSLANAQNRGQAAPPQVKTTSLAGNVYGIDGPGGRMAALLGPEGILLVDAQSPAVTDRIVASLKEISPAPIRFLVNTHVHADHTGGNENFGKLGVTILGRPNLLEQLVHPVPATNGQIPPPSPASALPIILFDNPVTINLDGECPDSMEGQIDLVATRDGAIDGVGGWFECELVPGVSMSNSPLDPDRIRREQAFFPFDRGLDAMTGDRICTTMNVRHDPGIIGWRSENVRTGEIRNQSTWRSQILSEADFIPASVRVPKLSRAGIAAQVVAGFIDGKRTAREIEDAVALEYPSLLLSEAEVRSFVRSELARVAG